MRKLISLLLAVVMVMGLATVAFAEAPEDLMFFTIGEVPESFTLAAGQSANFIFSPGPMNNLAALAGGAVTVTGDGAGQLILNYPQPLVENEGVYTATDSISPTSAMVGFSFTVTNNGTAEAEYSISYTYAPGTSGNPLEIAPGEDIVFDSSANAAVPYTYCYKYTAGETAEIVTISGIEIVAGDAANIVPSVALHTDNADSVMEDGVATIGLYAGETVVITMTLIEQDMETAEYYVSALFDMATEEAPAGAKVNPIEVDAAGDYVVSGDEVWYAVNSRLAGYIIAVQGDEASVEIDGTVINAVDGVATAVLNGDGATIAVKVSNATDMIIMPAPTEIKTAGDYTVDVAAGAEVELAVNSKLAGAVLTVKGEGAYILIGTTKYQAVDGVATAVLDGEGATIAVKIGNASKNAAKYELNIAYAPTAINAYGEYKVTVGAGAEVEYAVNSKLDGAYVTVKGEGAYLIVDGKKIEGKDGVVSTVLAAKGATIKLVVGNAGTASAEYTIVVSANPATGDFGVIAAAVALAVSAMGGTAVIVKKKEN